MDSSTRLGKPQAAPRAFIRQSRSSRGTPLTPPNLEAHLAEADQPDNLAFFSLPRGAAHRVASLHRRAESTDTSLDCPSVSAWSSALDLPKQRNSHVEHKFVRSWHRKGCWCRWKNEATQGTEAGLDCDAVEYKYYRKDGELIRGRKKKPSDVVPSGARSSAHSKSASGARPSVAGSAASGRTAATPRSSGSLRSSASAAPLTAPSASTGSAAAATSAGHLGISSQGTATSSIATTGVSSRSASTTESGAAVPASASGSSRSGTANPGNNTASSNDHTLAAALGGTLGSLAFIAVLGLLFLFCLRRKRQNRANAAGRESFAAVGNSRDTRGFLQIGGYGATLAGAGAGAGAAAAARDPSPGPMSPEEPQDLRYSATGVGLLDRLRGMTDTLMTGSHAAGGATAVGAAGLSPGSQRDGTDPFSDTQATQFGNAVAGRYASADQAAAAAAVAAAGRHSQESEELSYPQGSAGGSDLGHSSGTNGGGITDGGGGGKVSPGEQEAVKFESSEENGGAESPPRAERKPAGENGSPWWGDNGPER